MYIYIYYTYMVVVASKKSLPEMATDQATTATIRRISRPELSDLAHDWWRETSAAASTCLGLLPFRPLLVVPQNMMFGGYKML